MPDPDIDALVAEAERGYDLDQITPVPRWTLTMSCPNGHVYALSIEKFMSPAEIGQWYADGAKLGGVPGRVDYAIESNRVQDLGCDCAMPYHQPGWPYAICPSCRETRKVLKHETFAKHKHPWSTHAKDGAEWEDNYGYRCTGSGMARPTSKEEMRAIRISQRQDDGPDEVHQDAPGVDA